ncbi:Asp23/Gls24 family envelope stress response protein, partial [Staphylococcus epidermidis]|uniref:Asp23/Gls24 family envelope stress response protein n=1 Tax=Staphylococcus epidermidis TaxID=1282 RepID=UPI0037D9CF2A
MDISNDVIPSLVAAKPLQTYPILPIPTTQQLTHPIPQILPHHNYPKPIKLTQDNPIIHLHIYIIVTYRLKISQVANNLQSTLKYTLQKTLNLK